MKPESQKAKQRARKLVKDSMTRLEITRLFVLSSNVSPSESAQFI